MSAADTGLQARDSCPGNRSRRLPGPGCWLQPLFISALPLAPRLCSWPLLFTTAESRGSCLAAADCVSSLVCHARVRE